MYHNCIFCSADLGSNDSLEEFPVGRSIAFDAARGRLWAVCPRCARWNLAPIEERWEAIEHAERLFRDSRVRVQSENVGLARLRDRTRLIRVGAAQPGELAVWRYGQGLIRRRQRLVITAGTAAMLGGGGLVVAAGIAGGVIGAAFLAGLGYVASSFVQDMLDGERKTRVIHRLAAAETPHGRPLEVKGRHLVGARLTRPAEPGGIAVALPAVVPAGAPPLVIQGAAGRRLLSRAMVHVNRHGGRREWLETAIDRIGAHGTADEFLRDAAEREKLLLPFGDPSINPVDRLALEMAVHEDAERRAMQGELAGLEAMWREAEEIAALADRLPDGDDPPRIGGAAGDGAF
jgi:hypothetical protein